MREYVPALQDRLRKLGFPGFNREQIQQFVIGPEPKSETSLRWCFVSRDKREGVVLTEDFVVYETTRYEVFDTFVERVRTVLSELNEIASVDFATQIGLRYIDVIHELDGHEPAWFIRQQFQGLSPDAVGEPEVMNQFFSMIKTSEGLLKLKSIEGCGSSFMPPDLEANRLKFALSLADDAAFRILDFDHIWKGEIDFAPDQIIEKMWAIHGSIGKAFRATVTPEALAVWEAKGSE